MKKKAGEIKTLDSLMSERQVAEITGLSIMTLQRWRMLGRGPRFRKLNGGSVRYSLSDLEAWLHAQPAGGEDIPHLALKVRA